jgi:hypothetical protein
MVQELNELSVPNQLGKAYSTAENYCTSSSSVGIVLLISLSCHNFFGFQNLVVSIRPLAWNLRDESPEVVSSACSLYEPSPLLIVKCDATWRNAE